MILTRSSEIHNPLSTCGMNATPSPGVDIPANASQAYWNSDVGRGGSVERDGLGEGARDAYGEDGRERLDRCGRGCGCENGLGDASVEFGVVG